MEVVSVVGEAPSHDVVGDDGINLDAGDAWAAIGDRAQNVNAAAGPDNREVTVWTEYVGQRSRLGHQLAAVIVAPMVGVGVHQRGLRVGVDDNCASRALLIYFHT